MPGPTQILIIVLVLVLLFGAAKLPNMARSLGRSMRIFKSEMTELKNDGNDSDKTEDGDSADNTNAESIEAPKSVDGDTGKNQSKAPSSSND